MYICFLSITKLFISNKTQLAIKHKKKKLGVSLRRATSRRQFNFYHQVPRDSWYLSYQPQKDEQLIRAWSNSAVLNLGPLDWQSRTLTTKPLLILINLEIYKTKRNPSLDYFWGNSFGCLIPIMYALLLFV